MPDSGHKKRPASIVIVPVRKMSRHDAPDVQAFLKQASDEPKKYHIDEAPEIEGSNFRSAFPKEPGQPPNIGDGAVFYAARLDKWSKKEVFVTVYIRTDGLPRH